MEHIVIIGNGIAGITAARHIRKASDCKITVISGESDYFFSRTALMYVYMGHMKWDHLKPYEDWFWEKNRIELKNAWVDHIDFQHKELTFSSEETLHYDKLILATGSLPNRFGWPGENLNGVQGMVTKQDLEKLEERTSSIKQAVVIGGGLIGVELAEMLHTRKIPVTLLVREKGFWSGVLPPKDAKMISEHILAHGIDLRHETELEEILGDEQGNVRAVRTKSGEEITCEFVGLCAGVKPNISFLENLEIETEKGILVNEFLETSIPDVYAIGDCAQQRKAIGERKPVEAVWYTGRLMGETLARTITGNRTPYQPGNWFNSAKFFDIEYQTYGWVFNKPRPNEQHFHWQHESGEKAITIAFDTETEKFKGINTFGIRMRQEVFDKWLNEGKTINHVLSNLKAANFDPEFYEHHEAEIFKSFKNNLQST